ncbi:uncharacterized protein LOC133834342 [Humulus lupulus]|uniref:uncharacterized protein LOC133834342 n=1 Tax=Humulus lupulus TaxID=3486 RepID=UPI002B4035B2|nr:uncharacterized protein LOC133834342 [Humulus lupulus]
MVLGNGYAAGRPRFLTPGQSRPRFSAALQVVLGAAGVLGAARGSTLQVFSATTAVAAEVSVEFENPLKSSMEGSKRRQLRTNGGSRSGCGFGRTVGVSPPKASHGLTTHRVIAWEEK